MLTRGKYLRLQAGFTQAEICDLIGASKKWLIDFEKGRINTDVISHGRATAMELILGEPIELLIQQMESGSITEAATINQKPAGGNVNEE